MKNKKIKRAIIATAGVVAAGIIVKIGWHTINYSPMQDLYGVPRSEYEVGFNDSFKNYEGTRRSPNVVKYLYSKIKANNATHNAKKGDKFYVQYTGPETSEIKAGKKYTVELKYNNEGYVCEVVVTENEEEDSNATQHNNVNEINNNTENTNEDVIKPIQR